MKTGKLLQIPITFSSLFRSVSLSVWQLGKSRLKRYGLHDLDATGEKEVIF